jgi:hypothetical protein
MALKMGKTVLIEIVAIVQKGLLQATDISQQLREVEFELDEQEPGTVRLSDYYVAKQADDAENF